jgi:hypothetical protein
MMNPIECLVSAETLKRSYGTASYTLKVGGVIRPAHERKKEEKTGNQRCYGTCIFQLVPSGP